MDVEDVLDTPAEAAPLWCPSGHGREAESVVLGVRSQDDGGLTYLAEPMPAAEALALVPAGIEPTRVLRFASHCESGCAHRAGPECTLITKLRTLPPKAADAPLPHCHLRHHCKWWNQAGADACGRCPAVATTILSTETTVSRAADPSVTPEQLRAWIEANPTGPPGC
ncbi:hypothetical protein CFP65_0329 [Kitasatospora sp. MMS16-BH015]|uniref:hypothetical protein n=1 Tax=Kitasatospora sp. MMS16-BH015 TaxID=2018025 RepID=UPI000CA3D6A1|nr:hypothetical protein [Kitasatospora sp. MMS16-BH015]AUG75303.1 hypothetical protein CFP65_0329 [Kitasatospora sp. MMS16-BH015]